jgi:multiple sugar transport system substrate-binding protein
MKKILVVLCVLSMVLAACGGGDGQETPSPAPVPTAAPTQPAVEQEPEREQVTVRFAVFDWERPVYEDLIKAFEEENPDVKVQLVSANEVLGLGPITDLDFPEDTERRLASAADVVTFGVSKEVVREELVRDLTPFIAADPNFQADDFYPDTLEGHQWDGGTWAIPTTILFQLIFFDKDAFDEIGVPYPEPGWSWDDFVANAQALTAREGDEVTRWGFVPSGTNHRTLVESRVGLVIDGSTEPPTPRLDEAEVIDAVRWYADLFLREQVAPYFEPPEETEGELVLPEEQALIDKGQAAMWPENYATFWFRNQQGNMGVAPFPVEAPDGHSTPAGTQSLSMSAGTSQPNAAWRLLDFLSRQVVGGLGAGIEYLPARRSVAESSGFWENVDEELGVALRYAVDHSYRPDWLAGHQAFSDALHAILSGEKSVDDALAEAQTQAEHEIQEAQAAEAGATPAPTVVVAPPAEETPAGEGATTITFVPGLGSLNLEPYRDLADRFHEANPEIVVEVKMIDLTSGSAPDLPGMAEAADCFQWYPSFQEARNREAILNLEPFLDADPSFSTDDFFPQLLDQFSWQGQLWGLPADVTPYIIEYNKGLFDAAGVEYPSLDWTTDDFLALAVALTQGEDDAKQYGFVGEVYALNDLLFLMERLGARLVDVDADPPAITYNDPSTVEAMRWYVSLSAEHGVKPEFLTDITKLAGATAFYLEREALINDGRAAMWTNTGATAGLFGPRTGIEIGAAPLPTGPGVTGGGYSSASGYFISAETENRQACWQWITFLSGEPGAVQGLPARRSLAESDEYRQQVGADRADAYLASVADSDQPSAFQIFSEEEWLGGALFWLGQAYGQAIDGEASVEEALDAAQKMADDYRACVVAAGDFSQETWQACVQEIDPTLPDFLFAPGG